MLIEAIHQESINQQEFIMNEGRASAEKVGDLWLGD